jgi:sulfite reductase (NADPH) flavoprotein alpha-component
MNHMAAPPVPPFIPENAPFSPEQRAWLNGFFAGLLAPEAGVFEPVALQSEDAGDDAPWHDPALPIEERMKLAEGRPLRRRLMAAMAQQDCGQCGYICETYADALASSTETRLNLCAPGEKETLRVLKALVAELNPESAASSPARAEPTVTPSSRPAPKPGTREHPVEVRFLSRRRLNKADSEKSTYHIEIDLSGSSLKYQVGDSLGVLPQNDPTLVDAVLAAIHAPPDFPIADQPLRDVLLNELCLGTAPDSLFELISYITGGERRRIAKSLAKGEDPEGDAATLDVLAALEKFPGIRPDPEAFVESLAPLQPRLYSISSSPKVDPERLSLTVDHVRYLVKDRVRHGVASSWLSERLTPSTRLKAFIRPAHDFALPENPNVPIIMVGPGTGVAPFRAFLQERRATKAQGGAWLFFGHQRRAADFFYEEEFADISAAGTLSRLSLAWSRDGETKAYVQDKMREDAEELWAWLLKGAHFYVCGDAKRMAADVEKTLIDIAAEKGKMDIGAAKDFVRGLKKGGRYQTDVY